MIRYGAKSMPYGGWWAIPPVAGDGWMILGDSAGFLNSQRLKGIHLAIKSGMLAAETAFDALKKNDASAATLGEYQKRVDSSWIKEELWKVRNFHQGFEKGFYAGMFHAGLQQFTGGRGLWNRYPAHAGHERMKKLARTARRRRRRSPPARPRQRRRQAHLRQAHRPLPLRHEARRRPARAPGHRTTPTSATRAAQRNSAAPARTSAPPTSTKWSTTPAQPHRQAHQPEPFQLRALQNLRHHGPLPDHHLGPTRGRRRAELRRDVSCVARAPCPRDGGRLHTCPLQAASVATSPRLPPTNVECPSAGKDSRSCFEGSSCWAFFLFAASLPSPSNPPRPPRPRTPEAPHRP